MKLKLEIHSNNLVSASGTDCLFFWERQVSNEAIENLVVGATVEDVAVPGLTVTECSPYTPMKGTMEVTEAQFFALVGA